MTLTKQDKKFIVISTILLILITIGAWYIATHEVFIETKTDAMKTTMQLLAACYL